VAAGELADVGNWKLGVGGEEIWGVECERDQRAEESKQCTAAGHEVPWLVSIQKSARAMITGLLDIN
jgi:hypothetical protein